MLPRYKLPLLFLLCIAFILGCRDNKDVPPFPSIPSVNTNHNYFPSNDSNQWVYLQTTLNENGVIIREDTLIGYYDKSLSQINYYLGNTPRGYSIWYNLGNVLMCCNGVVLLNYNELKCTTDSVLIRKDTTENNISIETYQFCKSAALDLEGYESIENVKTRQTNISSNNTKLVIDRYFGYGVGLMYDKQTQYGPDGQPIQTSIKQLIKHSF
jgi:hypothetical protein